MNPAGKLQVLTSAQIQAETFTNILGTLSPEFNKLLGELDVFATTSIAFVELRPRFLQPGNTLPATSPPNSRVHTRAQAWIATVRVCWSWKVNVTLISLEEAGISKAFAHPKALNEGSVTPDVVATQLASYVSYRTKKRGPCGGRSIWYWVSDSLWVVGITALSAGIFA